MRLAFEDLLAEERDPSLLATATTLQAALARQPGEPTVGELPQLVQRLVEGWAFRSPVIVAVDDLHHADAQTAATVLHLMRTVRSQRVLVVATTRPPPALAAGVDVAITRLCDHGATRLLALSPLLDDELVELIRAADRTRTGGASRGPAPRPVRRHAAVRHRAARRDGALRRSRGPRRPGRRARPGPSGLPTRLSTAVLHRVFGLEPDARAVARAAAVMGTVPGGGLGLVAAVAGLDEVRSARALGALERAGVLAAVDGDHRFAHALVRDAIYHDIGPAARRRLHGRVAAAVSSGGPWGTADVVEVARHVLASTTGPDSSAAQALAAAGDSIADVTPRAAAGWYRAALERLAPDDSAVVDVQLALADVLDLTGAHREAARIAAAALAASTDAGAAKSGRHGAGPRAARGRLRTSGPSSCSMWRPPIRTCRRRTSPCTSPPRCSGPIGGPRFRSCSPTQPPARAASTTCVMRSTSSRCSPTAASRPPTSVAAGYGPLRRSCRRRSARCCTCRHARRARSTSTRPMRSPSPMRTATDAPRAGLLAALASWAHYRAGAFAELGTDGRRRARGVRARLGRTGPVARRAHRGGCRARRPDRRRARRPRRRPAVRGDVRDRSGHRPRDVPASRRRPRRRRGGADRRDPARGPARSGRLPGPRTRGGGGGGGGARRHAGWPATTTRGSRPSTTTRPAWPPRPASL